MDIIDQDISLNDIKILRSQYAKEKQSGFVESQTKFEYAYNLCRSKDPECLTLALKLFEDLRSQCYDKAAIRDYLFFECIAYLKLKKYEEALDFVDVILKSEPNNKQIIDLKERIKKDQNRDGLVGAAVIGGAAAIGVLGALAVVAGISLAKKK